MKPQIRRHKRITALAREHGSMPVEQLAREPEIIPQAIRCDIGILSAGNALRRYHGDAALGEVLLEGEFGQGGHHNHKEEKNTIVQFIAARIPDSASLLISIGTTMETVVVALIKQRKNLCIITNNIYVAVLASVRSDCAVITTSGVVRPLDGGVIDVAMVDFINRFKVNYAVLNTYGIGDDGSSLDYDYKEVSVVQAMTANAWVHFLGVDHNKFQSHALVRLGDITDFDRAFTDRTSDGEMQKTLTVVGVEWLVSEICQHVTETTGDEK